MTTNSGNTLPANLPMLPSINSLLRTVGAQQTGSTANLINAPTDMYNALANPGAALSATGNAIVTATGTQFAQSMGTTPGSIAIILTGIVFVVIAMVGISRGAISITAGGITSMAAKSAETSSNVGIIHKALVPSRSK